MSRILLVFPEFPPTVGGMQTHAWEMASRFSVFAEVLVLTTQAPISLAHKASELDNACCFSVSRVLCRVSYWAAQKAVVAAAKYFRPDIIYASNVYFGHAAALSGIPIVCRSVGNDVQRPWIVWPFRVGHRLLANEKLERLLYEFFRKRKRLEFFERILQATRLKTMRSSLARNDFVLSNSQYTTDILAREGFPTHQIITTVGGVDARRFAQERYCMRGSPLEHEQLRQSFGIGREQFLLFVACRLVPKKGIDLLLKALSGLLRKHSHVFLAIAGGGPLQSSLQALASDLQLDNSCRFLGNCALELMPKLYAMADLYVQPSCEHHIARTGFVDVETMGRALCEAMAAGLPVLATTSGGIPSVIVHGKTGFLVAPGSSAALENGLAFLLEHDQERQTLGCNAQLHALKEFDWERILQTHCEVFERISRKTFCSNSNTILRNIRFRLR